jgi:hypothetical protein
MIRILRHIFGLCEHTLEIIHDDITEFLPYIRTVAQRCTKCGHITIKKFRVG